MVSQCLAFIRIEAANLYQGYKNSSSDLLVLPGVFTPWERLLGFAPRLGSIDVRRLEMSQVPRALVCLDSEVSVLGTGCPAKRNEVLSYSACVCPNK